MRQGIHPDYVITKVTCSCGNTFTTRSVKPELHVELCNQCHPFYTGKQKLVDTGGRVERFEKKYAKQRAAAAARSGVVAEAPAEAETEPPAEPVAELPAEPVAEPPAEPVAEPPAESSQESDTVLAEAPAGEEA